MAESFTLTYDTPGTYEWICPSGVRQVYAECTGGGGGGSGGDGPGFATCGGGGGSGGYGAGFVEVTPGDTYTVTVGRGGDGVPYNLAPVAANSGLPSLFLGNDRAIGGGAGGAGGRASRTQNGGLGGGASGDIALPGQTAANATNFIATKGADAPGPAGGLGGAPGVSGSPAGQAGTPRGAGGGGSFSDRNAGFPGYAGGAGAPGLVVITYTVTTDPVVRMFPRDDGRGMASAPRIWPTQKGRARIVGGHQ